MKPRLFPSDATAFNTMGYGVIDAIKCTVKESLNGEFQLNMSMLNSDPNFTRMEVGSILAVQPNQTDPIQAFCIESIGKAINGEVEVYATHIAQFRTKLIPVANYTATDLADAISKALTNSLETNPFSLTTDKTVATSFELAAPRSFRELMGGKEGSILDKYGGEYYYNNFDIQLLNHRGEDNGVRIFYGKNMTDFKADDSFSWSDSATGVVPIWYNEDEGLVKGDAQYSPYRDNYSYARTIVKDYTDQYQTKPTKAELETEASAWISTRGLPYTNLSVSFDDLITDNRGKLIALGDTVHIVNSLYGVNYTSRIISMTYDVLLERYDNVEIGDKKASINDAINGAVSTKEGGSSFVYELLWENDSPTSNFAEQTLPINLNGYAFVLIETRERASSSRSITFTVPVESPDNPFWMYGWRDNSGIALVSRSGIVAPTGITFGTGHNYALSSATWTDNDSRLVPIKIYGIK